MCVYFLIEIETQLCDIMSDPFDPSAFLNEADFDKLENLKKENLIALAGEANIAVPKRDRKAIICDTLVKGLVEKGIIPETHKLAVGSVKSSVTSDAVLLKQLEIEHQRLLFEQKRLEEITKQKQIDADHAEKQKQIDADHAEKMKELELRSAGSSTPHTGFDACRNIRLVPPFSEKDVDKYFLHFEKVAQSLRWPVESWTLLLQSVIKGKAQEAYSSLSISDASDYQTVKAAILKAYALVPEAYRQKFRNLRKNDSATYVEFAREKEDLFNRWCSSVKAADYEGLREVMLVEEFKRCLPSDVKTFLDEHKVDKLKEAATLADDYALTHRNFARRGNHYQKSEYKTQSQSTTTAQKSQELAGAENISGSVKSKMSCFYCKKEGDKMADCRVLQRKGTKPTSNGLIASRKEKSDKDKSFCNVEAQYLPFVSSGVVSVSGHDDVQVVILRDTGASQSLLLEGVVDLNDSFTGKSILIKGVECRNFLTVPLHSIHLQSELYTGKAEVGVRPELPVRGVSFILGNDLAGGKVSVNPIVVDKPQLSEKDELGEEFPNAFTSCVMTRSRAKLAKSQTENSLDDSVENLSALFGSDDDAVVQVDSCVKPEIVDTCKSSSSVDDDNCVKPEIVDTCQSSISVDNVKELDLYMLNRDDLIREQNNDPQLTTYVNSAVADEVRKDVKEQVCF